MRVKIAQDVSDKNYTFSTVLENMTPFMGKQCHTRFVLPIRAQTKFMLVSQLQTKFM